jgi:putative transposase
VTVIEDLVSRKWLAEVVSSEETSVQVQAAFCQALEAEGLMEQVAARLDGTLELAVDDSARPILLAMSDNGPQMTSGSTREFMALCAIHQHFGRPGTPTDQAWIESLFGHVKAEYPSCWPSATPPPCGPSLPGSASTTTASGCTPASAM